MQGDFYVPRFEIKIAGANLPQNVLRDVMQVTYKDSVKEIDSFEITVNNWDAEKREFKYVGSETTRFPEQESAASAVRSIAPRSRRSRWDTQTI